MFQLLVLLLFRNKVTDEIVHVGKDVQREDSRSLIISNRSEEEGASLIGQLLKNPPAMQETGSIPGSGRSTGEGIGYPLQYSWASLVAQLVKNPPAMLETWV